MSAVPVVAPTYPLALTPAAQQAADVDPRMVLQRWFAGLGHEARRKYKRCLTQFAAWAATDVDPNPEAAMRILIGAGRAPARGLAMGFRQSLEEADKSSATVASAMSALASCVTAARLAGLCEWHLEKVAPKVEQRHDRSGPPRHEVELLLARIDEECEGDPGHRKTRHAIRDAALVRLLHNAALRRFEALGLRIQDVQLDHPDGPRVLPLRKGHKERQPMLVGNRAAESLRRWLEIRGTTEPTAWLFVRLHLAKDATTDGPLSGESLRCMLQRRAKAAGVRAAVRPHGLRHSAATHCARNASLAALKRLGGWTTLSSPARYLDSDDRDRQQAVSVVEV